MAAAASFCERNAMEVEREVVDLYRAFFLRDRIGDVFDGTISGVAGFGVFVVVDDPFVEGLVRVGALSDDFYEFDEATCRLVGRRSGRVFALGDAVKVEVQSVSVVRRKVDFALAGHAAREHARPERAGDHKRSRHARAGTDERRAGRDKRRTKREHAKTDKKGRGAGKSKGKRR
jgi:ribonuclease R